MHRFSLRLLFAAVLGASILGLHSASWAGDPSPSGVQQSSVRIPVIPTIPAPLPPMTHHVRYQDLVPVGGAPEKPKPNGEKDKNGKVEEGKSEIPALVDVGPALSLGECIAVAMERQPSLKAVRASMGATQAGNAALLKFGTPATFLSPDLEIRKQQAQRGLAASAADYQKAQNEVVQDVTRLYYSAVYAKQAEAIANDVAGSLTETIKIAWKILETEPDPKKLDGLTKAKILAMEVGLSQVRQKQAEARIGRMQAMAALRQIMAVDEQSYPFHIKDTELPLMAQKVAITKEMVVELAVSRRPELALAAAGVDAFRLEVYAQGKVPFKRVVPTFASGSDLHSKAIPQAIRGKEYRPGGIIPEMPTQLVGSKYDRVCRAMFFSQRADAVFESAQSLVTLEAENGYLEFLLESEKLRLQQEQLKLALQIVEDARKQGQSTNAKDRIVQAEILGAQAQASYLEAVFRHLLALSALERITAGGIKPAFPER